jgi:hypothetical protein
VPDDDLNGACDDLVSENSIKTGDHRHFIPKKLGRNYNAVSMNGDSPYKAMGGRQFFEN